MCTQTWGRVCRRPPWEYSVSGLCWTRGVHRHQRKTPAKPVCCCSAGRRNRHRTGRSSSWCLSLFPGESHNKSKPSSLKAPNEHAHTHAHTHPHTHIHTRARARTHSHTRHHLRITCHKNPHTKRLKIKPLELHLHSLSLFFSLLAHTQVQVTCSFTGGKVGWAVEHTEKF